MVLLSNLPTCIPIFIRKSRRARTIKHPNLNLLDLQYRIHNMFLQQLKNRKINFHKRTNKIKTSRKTHQNPRTKHPLSHSCSNARQTIHTN